jgi:hypothetical protein
MHPTSSLTWLVACLFIQTAGTTLLRAETRAFTDSMGRTLRGELVGVTGDFVTIKRESDGQNFTVKASGFSPIDIAYFKQHGLASTAGIEHQPSPAVPAAGVSTETASLRLDVVVNPKKVDRNRPGRGNYATIERITFKIDIRNTERQRGLPKAHGTILSLARVLSAPDESQIVGREEFDFKLDPVGSFEYESKDQAKAYFYGYNQSFGTRYTGYVLVVKDEAGKIVYASGSSETAAKHGEELLKLGLWDQFDKNYKKTKEGFAPIY